MKIDTQQRAEISMQEALDRERKVLQYVIHLAVLRAREPGRLAAP
jgi:hypothetical protein